MKFSPLNRGPVRRGYLPRARPGASAKLWPVTVAEWSASMAGREPAHNWLFDEASGDLLDHIGSYDMSPQDSPVRSVSSFPGKTSTQFVYNTLDSFDAADGTVADFTGSFAFLVAAYFGTDNAASRDVFAKPAGAAPIDGYQARLTAGGTPTWTVGDGTSDVTVNGSTDHEGEHSGLLFLCDQDADIIGLYSTRQSEQTASIAAIGDTSAAAAVLAFGSRNSFCASQIAHQYALFEGTEAEGMGQAELDAYWAGRA